MNAPLNDGLTPTQRMARAEAAVRETFETITTALLRAEIPFAVVGNQATSLWIATIDKGATRNARDTEILVRRRDIASVCATA